MQINIDRKNPVPVYLQIRNEIRERILDGSLPDGTKLPPERKLASDLNVNRSTILNAYRELKADGYADSRVGQGTVICRGIAGKGTAEVKTPDPLMWRQLFSESTTRSKDTLTRDIIELANRKDIISFAAGVAMPGMDSIDILSEIQQKLLAEKGQAALQITPTEGLYSLRESISGLMEKRGISSSPGEIIVLSGSQQGLDLSVRVLVDPGDIVVVEEPTFFCALQIFHAAGARVVGVPVDENGIRTDILETVLERYRPKLIYTMPTFQNPSGIVMSYERRERLLELVYKYKVPVLEDDAYGELRYEGEEVPSLKAMDKYGYVIYLSSFSKILFQGLRVGWMAASKPLIQQIAIAKQLADLHTSSLPQWIFNTFLRDGYFDRHIELVKDGNRSRRDIMLKELERFSVPGFEWNRPEGGLYIWCTLPPGTVLNSLVARAADRGVAFVPGDVFYPGGYDRNHIRLNFTYPDPSRIQLGVRRLMQSISRETGDTDDEPEEIPEIRPIV